jgi:hypothetical protein
MQIKQKCLFVLRIACLNIYGHNCCEYAEMLNYLAENYFGK